MVENLIPLVTVSGRSDEAVWPAVTWLTDAGTWVGAVTRSSVRCLRENGVADRSGPCPLTLLQFNHAVTRHKLISTTWSTVPSAPGAVSTSVVAPATPVRG